MKKIKQIISGVLASLTISGLVSCGEPRKSTQEVDEEKDSYVVELPIADEENLLEPNYEKELKSLINNLDMDAILVRYEFDKLIIADQQQGKIDYDKLNEIIEAYSKIDSYHKDIIYIPFYLYNIDFSKLNIKNIDLSITLSYPITAENNLITAINKAKDVTLYVRYSNELDEKSNSSILNIIEQVANKNGTLDIQSTETLSNTAINDILSKIKKEWHFNSIFITTRSDISAYLPNMNAKYLSLAFIDNVLSSTYRINEGTKILDIYCYTPNKTLYLEIPSSLIELYLNYNYMNKAIIKGNKNIELRATSSNYEKLNTYIELGYFDYDEFSLTAGDYTFKKQSFTDYEIVLDYNDEEIGTVELMRDETGNITDLKIIKKEKKLVRTLTKK